MGIVLCPQCGAYEVRCESCASSAARIAELEQQVRTLEEYATEGERIRLRSLEERAGDVEGMAKVIAHDVCCDVEEVDDYWASIPKNCRGSMR